MLNRGDKISCYCGYQNKQKISSSGPLWIVLVILGGLLLWVGGAALFAFYKNIQNEKVPDIDAIKQIIASNVGQDVKEKLLIKVVMSGDLNSARLLLDHGTDINVKIAITVQNDQSSSVDYDTLLTWAIRNQRIVTALFLIDHGPDINSPGFMGKRPLPTAIQNGEEELVNYLIYKGADVNLEDEDGYTPLLQAIDPFRSMNYYDESGREFLRRTTEDYISRMVLKLLACGAVPDYRNRNGETPLTMAYSRGEEFEEVVDFLVLFGAKGKRESENNVKLSEEYNKFLETAAALGFIRMSKGGTDAEINREYKKAFITLMGQESGKNAMDKYRRRLDESK